MALAETTPGPLIMVFQFVGFMAAGNHPERLPQTLSAMLGAPGTALVYCGSYLVPRYKKTVAICLAAFLLLLSGVSLVSRVSAKDGMGLLGIVYS